MCLISMYTGHKCLVDVTSAGLLPSRLFSPMYAAVQVARLAGHLL